MVKTVYIKLTKVSPTAGPFNIYDQWNNLIAENVSREDLIAGVGYILDDGITMIRLVSVGDCPLERIMPIENMTATEFFTTPTTIVSTGCVYKHLVAPNIYNTYYGNIEPYIIEYPFASEYYDEILQNVKDYTKAYRYLPNTDGAPSATDVIELDNEWFSHSIIYNGQQCTGLLKLTPKPSHNLQSYMTYPIYNTDSKTITYTKSDSFYQYNVFWDILNDKTQQMFIRSCTSLSLDKELNQSNMNYGMKSFLKSPIRGKEVKIRHLLMDKGDLKLVSRMIFSPSQISYK
jgi:hypothetical protein